LDYSLWEHIKNEALLVTDEDIAHIAERDTVGYEHKDTFWSSEGRESGVSRVIDFIGLSSRFDNLDQIPLLRESILKELERKATRRGFRRQMDFSAHADSWLEVNWPILAKVVGAAIAGCGREQGFWRTSGKDAQQSHKFWSDMKRETTKSAKGEYVDYDKWQDLVHSFREQKLDPSAAVLRGQAHPPSRPVIVEGNRYFQNPIAVDHRTRLRNGWDGVDVDSDTRFHEYHGYLTFEVIRKAMNDLANGKIADFLWSMHGLCAYHVMREEGLTQQKIGMHFVSGLAIRKTTRGVRCLAVPDIANSLKTGFGMGQVLKILHDAGLIDWYAVDVDIVQEAVTDLMSR
tara:strand:- start:77 stop:1111 length:1035 start_codon:yes stop_codon:yes gene_type:complete